MNLGGRARPVAVGVGEPVFYVMPPAFQFLPTSRVAAARPFDRASHLIDLPAECLRLGCLRQYLHLGAPTELGPDHPADVLQHLEHLRVLQDEDRREDRLDRQDERQERKWERIEPIVPREHEVG